MLRLIVKQLVIGFLCIIIRIVSRICSITGLIYLRWCRGQCALELMRLYNLTLEVYFPDASTWAGAIYARWMQRLMWRDKEAGAESAIAWTVTNLSKKWSQ